MEGEQRPWTGASGVAGPVHFRCECFLAKSIGSESRPMSWACMHACMAALARMIHGDGEENATRGSGQAESTHHHLYRRWSARLCVIGSRRGRTGDSIVAPCPVRPLEGSDQRLRRSRRDFGKMPGNCFESLQHGSSRRKKYPTGSRFAGADAWCVLDPGCVCVRREFMPTETEPYRKCRQGKALLLLYPACLNPATG